MMKNNTVNNNNRTRTKSFNCKSDGTQRLSSPVGHNGIFGNARGGSMSVFKYGQAMGPMGGPRGPKYYAGAKFDTIPTLGDLPVPPSHWTGDSITRSQSTPSSPITISDKVPMNGMFSGGLFKSASLPGESNMGRISPRNHGEPAIGFRAPPPKPKETKNSIDNMGPPIAIPKRIVHQQREHGITETKPANNTLKVDKSVKNIVEKDGSSSNGLGISGHDLMEMLLRASPTKGQDLKKTATPQKLATSCQLSYGSSDSTEYKDITDHLKSLLKVSA